MHPFFHIPVPFGDGTVTVPAYGSMIAVGFMVSLFLLVRRGPKMGLDPAALFDTAVSVLLAGVVGARIFYVVDNWNESFAAKWADLATQGYHGIGLLFQRLVLLIAVWEGGLAFFGGFLAGVAMLAWSIHKRALPILPTLDTFASLVPLGHAFGRLGCFLNGCCYGAVTGSPLGVCFPAGSPAWSEQFGGVAMEARPPFSNPVHPTQLYEMAYNVAIFTLLTFMFYRRRRAGDVAWTYAICYGTARFINQFFRADVPPIVGPFTIFHFISAGVALFGMVMLVRSLRKEPMPMPDPWVEPGESANNGHVKSES